MSREFDEYIEIVLKKIGVTGKKERQIREDLYSTLTEKLQITGESNPCALLGEPEEVAAEFKDNLNIEDNSRYKQIYLYGYNYEYKSKIKLFGLPLMHVCFKPFGIARGIIAIGNISVGVVSIGAISAGILSLGGLSVGLLLALGGASFSGGVAIGGAALSYFVSIGGLSIAKHFAFGGYAAADIAIGGAARGVVAVYREQGSGQHLFKTPVSVDEVISAIKSVYPHVSKIVVGLVRIFLG